MCIWIYRPFTINSAPPRGPRPTGWQAQGRTGLWLMTARKAWAASAAPPLLLSSWPWYFPPETLHWDLFTKNIFCVNFNKLVMTFHSGNIVFSCQNMYCTSNRDLNNWEKSHLNSRCTRSRHLLRCSSLSRWWYTVICCTTICTFVTSLCVCILSPIQSCLTLCDPMDCSSQNSPGQNTGGGSFSLLQGIFPTKGSNPGLPHCRRIHYQLSPKGSPNIIITVMKMFY